MIDAPPASSMNTPAGVAIGLNGSSFGRIHHNVEYRPLVVRGEIYLEESGSKTWRNCQTEQRGSCKLFLHR
jgi:hypothetical protein